MDSLLQKDIVSREVYDYKLQKWIPYISDPNTWYQPFLVLRDGFVQFDHLGRFMVGSRAEHTKLNKNEDKTSVEYGVSVHSSDGYGQVDTEKRKRDGVNTLGNHMTIDVCLILLEKDDPNTYWNLINSNKNQVLIVL